MAKPKGPMSEYNDISQALCDWFASQEIAPGKAVAVMGYLIGIMAADIASSRSQVIENVEMATLAAKAVGLGAFDCK